MGWKLFYVFGVVKLREVILCVCVGVVGSLLLWFG